MTSEGKVAYYDENGNAVYEPTQTFMTQFWSNIGNMDLPLNKAIKRNEAVEGEGEEEKSFDPNEFMRLLCASKAELAVAHDVLDILLLSEGKQPVNSNVPKLALTEGTRTKPTTIAGSAAAIDTKNFQIKFGHLKQVEEKLSKWSQSLRNNRQAESKIIREFLLPISRAFHWPILRPIYQSLIITFFDPLVFQIILLVDFSPQRLFRIAGESFEETKKLKMAAFQYFSPDRTHPENVAIIVQDRQGRVSLKFQTRNDSHKQRMRIIFEITGREGQIIFKDEFFAVDSQDLSCWSNEESSPDLWNQQLFHAQSAVIDQMIFDLIKKERNEMESEADASITVNLSPVASVTFSLVDCENFCQDSSGGFGKLAYQRLLQSFFESSGQSIEWKTVLNGFHLKASKQILSHLGVDCELSGNSIKVKDLRIINDLVCRIDEDTLTPLFNFNSTTATNEEFYDSLQKFF